MAANKIPATHFGKIAVESIQLYVAEGKLLKSPAMRSSRITESGPSDNDGGRAAEVFLPQTASAEIYVPLSPAALAQGDGLLLGIRAATTEGVSRCNT